MADEKEVAALRGGNALLIFGMLAVLVGLGAGADSATDIIGLADHESFTTASADSVARRGGRAIIVLTETLACLAFTGLSAYAMTMRVRVDRVWTARIAATTKVLWLLASVSVNWSEGWWYLLDPRGFTIWLGILSVLQALLWILAATTPEREISPPDRGTA